MKKSAIHHLLLLCFFLLVFSFAQAQPAELLNNPDFEGGFVTDGLYEVAEGWERWHLSPPPGSPSFVNREPEYYAVAPDTTRIRSGSDAQLILSFFATHTGGLYQTVSDVTPGSTLRFSIYAYVWSTTFDEADSSEEPGDVVVSVGIDPNGGVNPEGPNVIWSEPVERYDSYNEYAVEATAQSDIITVFVRTSVGIPVKYSNIYLDDASLVVISEAPVIEETDEPPVIEETEEPVVVDPLPEETDEPPITEETEEPPVVEETEEPPVVIDPQPEETDEPVIEETEEAPVVVDPLPEVTDEPPVIEETEEPVVPLPEETDEPVVEIPTLTPQPPTSTPIPTEEAPVIEETEEPPIVDAPLPTETPLPPPTSTMIPPAVTATFTPTPTFTPEAVAVFPTSTQIPPVAQPGDAAGGGLSPEFIASVNYTVQRGDTVARIAAAFGSSIQAIRDVNGLDSSYLIFVGQELVIPVRTLPTALPPVGSTTVYVVQPGDSLIRIAQRFNTTVATIAQINGIVNVSRLQVGQRLIVPAPQTEPPAPVPPAPPQQPRIYIVQPGDTLYRLSILFGVPIRRIAEANGIRQLNLIYVGQRLIIP